MWGDEKFRRLTPLKPSGAALFIRLLTGTELTNVPGLFPAWEAGMAQALGWTLEAFREAFREVSREGLVEANWEAGLVWVPNAIRHNEPSSPNVIVSWAKAVADMPDCSLKNRAIAAFFEWAKGKGIPWLKAMRKAFGKAFDNPSPKVCPNQDQDQDQDQDQRSEPPITPPSEPDFEFGQSESRSDAAPEPDTAEPLRLTAREPFGHTPPPEDQPGPKPRQRGSQTAKTPKAPKRPNQTETDPPDMIEPTEATLAAAVESGRNWAADWAQCRDWALSKGIRRVDWQATLRKWMRSNAEQSRGSQRIERTRKVQPNGGSYQWPKEWTGEGREAPPNDDF